MSRIGKKPVSLPEKVKATIAGSTVTIEGPLGKLDWTCPDVVKINHDTDKNEIVFSVDSTDRQHRALHGLTRALVNNMVVGVTQGYEKKLEIVGVGYLGAIQGDTLQLRVGFANEIHKKIPKELDVSCPDQTHVVVKGIDKQKVGQFAAEVRAVRKPEPYKGKGIRYQDEQVRRKAGKAVVK